MSEAGDYDPGPWAGHDFKSAKRSYVDHAGRSYDDAVKANKSKKDLIVTNLKTKSSAPLVIITDVTGSMRDWPATMFSKLPYLDHEARTEYLGEDVEISFGAIGDFAQGDTYPLQVRNFAKGKDELTKTLKELVIEGGGGGGGQESYHLAAFYYANNVEMPKAAKPVLIFIGDEALYTEVSKEEAELAGVKIEKPVGTKEVFEQLKEKFAVYFIHKPYGHCDANSGLRDPMTQQVRREWAALVGEDHIAYLSDAGRVVDVIFGILANESGRVDYFRKEIEDRQEPDQVNTVYKALGTIHKTGSNSGKAALPTSNSVLHSKKSKKKKEDDDAKGTDPKD